MMENLLTINKTTYKDEMLDLDDFIRHRLTPLVQKVKFQLYHMESSKRLQDYTRNKIQRATCLLETIDEQWRLLQLENTTSQYKQHILQQLEQAFSELSEKYRQLEQIQGDYFDYTFLDDTMDSLMSSIEQIDTCIGDTIDKASEMRHKVHEKINDFAGMAHEQMDHLKAAITYGAKRLLDYEELPVPWRNNKYIHTGYRFLSTPADCFHSWLYLHNESGNIYTHLIGFMVFLGIGIYELFYSNLLSDVPMFDWIIMTIFFLAACKCLMCSTVWHTLSGINDYHTFTRMACLDYVGISTLISASVLLCEYYGFYCNESWRNTYLIGTGSLALVGVTMPFMTWFDHPDSRWIRIGFFVALASSSIFPVGHLIFVYGPAPVGLWIAPVLKSLACYGLGVIVYGNQFPERIWPGKFDHWGHSHQWWHLFVCGGIWWHYLAAASFVSQRHEFGMCIL
ncbi:hemolysin-III related-domain-containing protein [Halteromyces radiatus]|uniref:hemolysin-III related-domain-containing protein n=1 Tax=Halteromyces radiatus TaxID=101107 RepID=UPI00222073CA|nr:hemolysin-III related-domain-containing protein [Halteromyces radiatus]KAI8086110.1 hemolysin-III related-domain-containing protein [Halteromyces radiatus]